MRLFDGQAGAGSASVNAFAQDSNGFFYAGTETGLYVSSGGEFTRADSGSETPFSHVTALAGGADGNLLVQAGQTLWLRSGLSFRKVPLQIQGNPQFSLSGKDFIVLAGEGPAQGGGLWRIHPEGEKPPVTERFVDERKDGPVPPGDPLTTQPLHALASAGDMLWAACGSALCRHKDGATTRFGTHEGVPADTWLALAVAPDGTLFARSADRLVQIHADNEINAETIPGTFSTSPASRIFLVATRNGTILTQGENTLLIRTPTGQWKPAEFLSKYNISQISAAFVDREEGVWLARPEQGIMRLAGFPSWESYGSDRGFPSGRISAVRRDSSGALWLATSKGLFRYNAFRNNETAGEKPEHYDIDARSLLRTGDGAIWAAGKGSALFRIDPGTGKTVSLPSQAPLTGALALDSGGRLWIGTAQGIVRLDEPLHPTARLPKAIALNDRRVNDLQFDQFGRLLALTDNVLFRQKSGEDYFEPKLNIPDLGIGEGRSVAVTMTNDIWIAGVRGGLRKIEISENGTLSASSPDDLHDTDEITSLFRDSRGWLWAGSTKGLDVLTSGGWRHFDVASGLISNQISYGAISEDDDGSMWFGTDNGFSRFTGAYALPPLPELHTCIISAYLGSADIRGIPRVWPENERDLNIRFASPTFLDNEYIRYKYILYGIDKEPHTVNSSEAKYLNFDKNKISFDVQAIDPVNNRVSSPAHLVAHPAGNTGRSSGLLSWLSIGSIIVFIAAGATYRWYISVRKKNIDKAVRDRTRVMEEVQTQLRQQSRIDSLTGLLNRRTIFDELSYLVSALAPNEILAVALIDIDHFKLINDTFGHQAGDFVLEQYGLRLRQTSSAGVITGRYGGEELIVVFPVVRTMEDIIEETNAIHRILCLPIKFDSNTIIATSSIGLAFLSPGDTPASLVGRADRALYKGKRAGRNRVVVSD